MDWSLMSNELKNSSPCSYAVCKENNNNNAILNENIRHKLIHPGLQNWNLLSQNAQLTRGPVYWINGKYEMSCSLPLIKESFNLNICQFFNLIHLFRAGEPATQRLRLLTFFSSGSGSLFLPQAAPAPAPGIFFRVAPAPRGQQTGSGS